MTGPRADKPRAIDRLGVRLALLLTVIMLPLGLIAIYQTYRVVEESENQSRIALLGETIRAAAPERELFLTIRGSAMALATSFGVGARVSDTNCEALLSAYVSAIEPVTRATFVDASGTTICASDERTRDPIAIPNPETPQSSFTVLSSLTAGDPPVIVFLEPVGGQGYIAVSVPHNVLKAQPLSGGELQRPTVLFTINRSGEVLTASTGRQSSQDYLPTRQSLAGLGDVESATFIDRTRTGEQKLFSIVPVLPDEVYALGSWPTGAMNTLSASYTVPTFVFPLLMWIASLIVVYYAVHTLALRYIDKLSGQMRNFSEGQRAMDLPFQRAPQEIQRLADTFQSMTERIIRDEADLENTIHEKDVLMKEVHHRVKNNLQLITSIINMQIRQSDGNEARQALKRIQERVMSLATIHRNLYEADQISSARADRILEEISKQLLSLGTAARPGARVETNFDEIVLYPDQALPISLLATEAITNSIKHLGETRDSDPWLKIDLLRISDDKVRFQIANSKSAVSTDGEAGSTKLGSQLIRTFAAQLNAHLETTETDAEYKLSVDFDLADFTPLRLAG